MEAVLSIKGNTRYRITKLGFDVKKYGEEASPYALPWDQINAVPIEASNIVAPKKDKLKPIMKPA
jgi:hypothetical protein